MTLGLSLLFRPLLHPPQIQGLWAGEGLESGVSPIVPLQGPPLLLSSLSASCSHDEAALSEARPFTLYPWPSPCCHVHYGQGLYLSVCGLEFLICPEHSFPWVSVPCVRGSKGQN